jgi:hypothetical protein
MNSNKERLTKTAVPTLMTTQFGGIVDLERYNSPILTGHNTREELENMGVELESEHLPPKEIILEEESETEGLEVVLHNNHLPKQLTVDPNDTEITLNIDAVESLHRQEIIVEEVTPSPKPPTRLIRVPRPKFLNRDIQILSIPSTPPAKRQKIVNSPPKPVNVQPVLVGRSSIHEISSTEEQGESDDPQPEVINTALIDELAQMKEAIKQQTDCYADFKSFLVRHHLHVLNFVLFLIALLNFRPNLSSP